MFSEISEIEDTVPIRSTVCVLRYVWYQGTVAMVIRKSEPKIEIIY